MAIQLIQGLVDRFRYIIKGGVVVQNGATIQNLSQGTSVALQPQDFSLNTEVKPSLVVGISNSTSSPSDTNTFESVSANQTNNGEIALRVTHQGKNLTYSAANQASVGVASGTAYTVLGTERYILFVNNSANRVSFDLSGAAAVLDKGATIQPNGGVFELSEANNNLPIAGTLVKAIASGAESLVGIQVAL